MRQTSIAGNNSFNGKLNMQRTFVDLNQYMSLLIYYKINPDRYNDETKQMKSRLHFQNRKYQIVVLFDI